MKHFTYQFCATAFVVAFSSSLASATTVMFDIDSVSGQGGTNLAGWIPVTGSGSSVTGTDGTYSLTVSGIASGRDRGTAATVQGADNGDNAVPAGVYGDMWRDFVFSTNGSSTVTISGLEPSTIYPVTIFSYDSGQGAVSTSSWDDVANSVSFIGDLVGAGPDPNTDLLTDYAVTFNVTTDGSGSVSFDGSLDSPGGLHLLNGVVVGDAAIPEPSSGILALVGSLLLIRRRR